VSTSAVAMIVSEPPFLDVPRSGEEAPNHVTLVLDEALGLLDDHVRHLRVPGGDLVDQRPIRLSRHSISGCIIHNDPRP
jgi:hypothetical protein